MTRRHLRSATSLSVVAGSLVSGTETDEDRYARRVDAVYAVLQHCPDFHSLNESGKLSVIEEVLAAVETGI